MHKRTTPKTLKRAKELRRDMTPQERKLFAHLRAHRMGGWKLTPFASTGLSTSFSKRAIDAKFTGFFAQFAAFALKTLDIAIAMKRNVRKACW